MINKLKTILSSIRFWTVTFGFLAAFFSDIGEQGFSISLLFEGVRNWLLVVAGIGTLDRAAERTGGK